MTAEVVTLEDVWKSYRGEEYVLRGVDLAIAAGEFAVVYGRSGSGKSTLLRILGLLDRPSKGRVRLMGSEASGLDESEAAELRLENVGFVFQNLSLIPHITVLENVEVPMWIKGTPADERRKRASELLAHFGLEGLAGRLPPEVSMGEQQRVAAIRAIVNGPKLVVADEPTAHLDDENAEALIEFMAQLNRDYSTTVVVSTTSSADAAKARKKYTLANGKLS